MAKESERSKPGRPRSESTRRALIEATYRLMQEQPIRNLTIEGIARAASVGKPTIYRWWGDKCSLVMEAFFESAAPRVTLPRRASFAESIGDHVRRVVKLLRGPSGRIAAEMVGEGQSQPEILEKFRRRFFEHLLSPAREALRAGKASGEFDDDLDEEFILDLVYGPICYRLLLGHQPMDARFARQMAEQAKRLLSAGRRQS